MDERNEKLQAGPDALPPEAAVPADAPETPETVQPPIVEEPEQEAAAEEVTTPEPAEVPEEDALAEALKPEGSKFNMAADARPPMSQHTQAFKPIRQAAQAVTDATVVIPAVKDIPNPTQEAPVKALEVSYFDGSTWAYIGWWFLGALITVLTLGVGLAWAQCMFWRYRAKHTVVCGRRLTFDGTGLQLFENYLIWGVLTVITLGIYGLWVPFKVRSWYCGHLYMTGYRRRHSVSKTPVWRDVLIFLTALLCFALLLTGIIVIATGNAPWQKSQPGKVQPPPPSSTLGETAPPITTPAPTTPAPTTPAPTTPEPTTTPLYTTPTPTQPKTYIVTAKGNLNLRANPSTSAKVLLAIPYRTVVTVEEWAGSWAKVTYQGKTGWVSGDYLREN